MKYYRFNYNYCDDGDAENGPSLSCDTIIVAGESERIARTVASAILGDYDFQLYGEVSEDCYSEYWNDVAEWDEMVELYEDHYTGCRS
jgi:hypothetical protein